MNHKIVKCEDDTYKVEETSEPKGKIKNPWGLGAGKYSNEPVLDRFGFQIKYGLFHNKIIFSYDLCDWTIVSEKSFSKSETKSFLEGFCKWLNSKTFTKIEQDQDDQGNISSVTIIPVTTADEAIIHD